MTDNTLYLQNIERGLADILSDESLMSPIAEAMRYSILGGGKRIRPTCVLLGAQAVGRDFDEEQITTLGLAIELIHGYSLVHDDLPSMDNDDYRRGKLTTHRQFGEANAILVGDALLSMAMSLLVKGSARFGTDFAEAAAYISSGAEDMVKGQAYDLAGMKGKREFLKMYSLKTGALIKAAFKAGAAAAGADKKQLQSIEKYAAALGLMFQLSDDLLDETDTRSYSFVHGQAAAVDLLESSTLTALAAAEMMANADDLKKLALKIQKRTN